MKHARARFATRRPGNTPRKENTMTMRVDLSSVQANYRLCFVRTPWACFTRLPLDRQWGDRWECAPYAPQAGLPYADEPGQILKLAFDGPLLAPDASSYAQPCSVQQINDGRLPWLRTAGYFGGEPVFVMAGATPQQFAELIELAGGTVYVPLGWAAR